MIPVLVPGCEALDGQPAAAIDAAPLAEIGRSGADASEPVTDSNGSDEYKHALVRTLIGRALGEAAARASQRAAGGG
jgi:CO/xanthine dehydrogenase FAD-binding subunit